MIRFITRITYLLILLVSLSQTPCAQIRGAERLIAPGATLQLVADSFKFTEGPAVDKAGNIFFTDQPNDRIWKYGVDGKLSLFMQNTGRSNGLYFDKKGNLLACADEKNELWKITPSKQITVLVGEREGKRYNGPNDLWIDKKGGIYFTDPLYRRSYWSNQSERISGEKVYYLPAGKKEPVIVEETIKKPNGIVGSADGKHIYVADIGDNKTYRFNIEKDGSLTGKTLFTNLGSDGMTLDSEGNVYLCGRGISISDSTGKEIGHIDLPKWTANICFGGKDRKLLFITASESVFTLQMKVKGIE